MYEIGMETIMNLSRYAISYNIVYHHKFRVIIIGLE